MYRLKEIRLYSGLGILGSFLLSVVFGSLAPNPTVYFCFGPDSLCDNLNPTWRDIYFPGTLRYVLASIGEVLTNVFFALMILCVVVFITSWIIIVFKRRTN